MAAAGAPPGTYSLGRLKLEVQSDGIVRLPGQQIFAGSALTPLEGFQRACRMFPEQQGYHWETFSLTAWRMMNLPAQLEPGTPANFCMVTMDKDSFVTAGTLYVRGAPTPLHIESRQA